MTITSIESMLVFTRFRFTKQSRRHRIGRAHALAAMRSAGMPVVDERGDLWWIGADDRGVELEIVGFVDQNDSTTVVIKHVMPRAFRRKK